MTTIIETVETDLPVDRVFDYVANFENIVEWDPGVTSASKLSSGPAGVGSEYALDLQYGGAPQSMVYRITEWVPSRLVVLEGDGSRTSAIDRIAFKPTYSGTVVEYRADIRLKGVFRFVQPFLGRFFRDVGTGAARGLEERLQQIAAESSS